MRMRSNRLWRRPLWRYALPTLLEGPAKLCAFKALRDKTLVAAGRPTDPIEIMLIEQLMVGHHRALVLHAKAAEANTIEAAKAYNAAVVRMMAELRRWPRRLAIIAHRSCPGA